MNYHFSPNLAKWQVCPITTFLLFCTLPAISRPMQISTGSEMPQPRSPHFYLRDSKAGICPMPHHNFPCTPSSASSTTVVRGNIFVWKTRTGTISVSITKTHRLKYVVQTPLPDQTLTLALVLLSINPYDLFGLMLYIVYKSKVCRKGIQLCNPKIQVDVTIPSLKLKKMSLAT